MAACKVCGNDPCGIGGFPEGAPFTSVIADGVVWVNIPRALNWNWCSIERGGSWCWEDVEHATWPAAPEAVDVAYIWGCSACGVLWPTFDPSGFAILVEPGHAGGGAPCHHCGQTAWPTVLGFACTCDPIPGAPNRGRNPHCRAGGLAL